MMNDLQSQMDNEFFSFIFGWQIIFRCLCNLHRSSLYFITIISAHANYNDASSLLISSRLKNIPVSSEIFCFLIQVFYDLWNY